MGASVDARPDERILIGHGSGGKLYRDLVQRVFVAAFANTVLEKLEDAAVLASPGGRIAFTTDAHVVQPLEFPGGDIGRLAVSGTVNDLATAAARPLALAAAFVIEEGFLLADLVRICASMASTAREAGVPIVTGDTKVVQRGLADGLYITTTGVGEVVVDHDVSPAAVRHGDAVLLSGSIGDHAAAVLAARGEFHFELALESDCAPLWSLVEAVLAELAESSGLGVDIEEAAVPVSPPVRALCELLGYDPFVLANEGKMVLVVGPEKAEDVLAALRRHPLGAKAARIGAITSEHPRRVALRTAFGTRRVLDMPSVPAACVQDAPRGRATRDSAQPLVGPARPPGWPQAVCGV